MPILFRGRWRRRAERRGEILDLMRATSLTLYDDRGLVLMSATLDDLAMLIKYGNNGGFSEPLPGGWRLEFTGPPAVSP